MLKYITHLKMYVSATPTPPIVSLRAWVQTCLNPQCPRELCEIIDTDGNIVQVERVSDKQNFFIPRNRIHQVHQTNIFTNEVEKFFGEPKPC